jgi:hypothetical protein
MPEPKAGSFREFHPITPLLTLYLQQRWQQVTFGGVNFGGRALLPQLVPADEISEVDYVELNVPGNGGSLIDELFIATPLHRETIHVKGWGFLCLRFSTWTTNVATPMRFTYFEGILQKRNSTGDIAECGRGGALTVMPTWVNISTVETKRSFFADMYQPSKIPMDFYLGPDERLVLHVLSSTSADGPNPGYQRLLFKRGEAESYVQLPVVEA